MWLTLLPCSFLHFFFSCKNVEDFMDDCYKGEAHLRAYSSSIPPCVGERHWPRVEQQLEPPSIKIGLGMPRKNRRKDPHENPKKPGRLTKHGIKMTYSVCKSKQHTKMKCPDKDMVVEPTLKRPKGRPRKDWAPPSSNQPGPSSYHLGAINEPTGIGKGGRVIRGGRGSKGGRGGIKNASSHVP